MVEPGVLGTGSEMGLTNQARAQLNGKTPSTSCDTDRKKAIFLSNAHCLRLHPPVERGLAQRQVGMSERDDLLGIYEPI